MVISSPQKQKATFGVRVVGFVILFDWLVVRQQSCTPGIFVFSLQLPSSTWVGAPVLQKTLKTLLCIFLF